MDPLLLDWLRLLLRWLHVITGIAWIGASFYFIWLDLSLEVASAEKQAKGFAGELWAIHGGGIYEVGKYRSHPDPMPATLHWFKWEAYSTWLTGTGLLILVYYVRADLYLLGAETWLSSPVAAIAASIAFLAAGLGLYEGMMRTALGGTVARQAVSLITLVVAASWLAFNLFAPRAAMLHVGAMLATIMAGNVFLAIIPSQKALIKAIEKGAFVDPALGIHAKHRSTHNNYLTLPVVFCMFASHAAFVFGHPHAWLLLSAICAIAAFARHYFNLKHRGKHHPIILGGSVVALVLVAVTASFTDGRIVSTDRQSVSAVEIQPLVTKHCAPCHAERPSFAGYAAPPAGMVFTSASDLDASAVLVASSLQTNYMPLGNLSGITADERATLIGWVTR